MILLDDRFSGSVNCMPDAIWVTMPSNIALIKYMGKASPEVNAPINDSLSITLPYLKSYIKISVHYKEEDEIFPLKEQNIHLELSEFGYQKFLLFWKKLKNIFQLKKIYQIYSGNNFPSDCGIASSSSSFAALTVAAYMVSLEIEKRELNNFSLEELAKISQEGSGSSIRSFMKEAVLWNIQGIKQVSFPFLKNGYHCVIICDDQKKQVSSSEAHQRVSTSLLIQHRKEIAAQRLAILMNPDVSWEQLYAVIWNEFWHMIALFETSANPFGYLNGSSMDILQLIRKQWHLQKDGPLITMDAGPNIHLLWRADQFEKIDHLMSQIKNKYPVKIIQGAL